jgi:hypothetical protein
LKRLIGNSPLKRQCLSRLLRDVKEHDGRGKTYQMTEILLALRKMSNPILAQILKHAQSARKTGERVLMVFDLDSTLFDLTPRIEQIIMAFADDTAMKAKYPQQCKALEQIQVSPRDWGIREPLERLGLLENEHAQFYREIHDYWAYCFFSNRYLPHDTPLPGAVEFVCALERLSCDIMYLTGRDVSRMQAGTEASLAQWKFPVRGAHIDIRLKPDPCMDDARFKLDVLKQAEKNYSQIWLFENEPVNLNLIQKHCPQIELIFIDSTHSGKEQVSAELARIEHFEVPAEAFREFIEKT